MPHSAPTALEVSDAASEWRGTGCPTKDRASFRPGMIWLLAWRNLVQDRVRFAATLVGIGFSVVLMALQWGLLIGCAWTAAALVDHARADFWVVSRGTLNVDQSLSLPARWQEKALAVPGVSAVHKYLLHFIDWRRPDGRNEFVNIVGFDTETGIGAPWKVVVGSIADLRIPHTVMMDRLYAEKLGIKRIGDAVEIGGVRAQVVGFTEGIRSFTQSPYIFSSFKNAQEYIHLPDDRTTYLLVRAELGADHDSVLAGLRSALPVTDVWSSRTFAWMTARYWLLTTGAGLALLIGAALGVVVGIAIVAQTLYAATVERLPEYATLIAIGAPNRYMNQIVMRQGLVSGVIGFALGIVVAQVIAFGAATSTAPLVLPWPLAVAVGVVAISMCAGAALLAIRKIKAIDPTVVFR